MGGNGGEQEIRQRLGRADIQDFFFLIPIITHTNSQQEKQKKKKKDGV
jgi:hypothetical protein